MGPIQIQIILEVLGRPADNVKQALASIVTKLEGEKGIKVLERVLHEPAPVPDAKDLYTAFAEVTLELPSLESYFGIIFAYMPSHVEMIYPERITLDNAALNHFANQLLQRLHNYDSVVKNVLVERDQVFKKIQQEAPHLLRKPSPTPPQNPKTQPSKEIPTASVPEKKKSAKKRKK